MDKLLGISKHFSLSIPSVLNYKEYSKAIVELKDLATLIEEVIKCLG